MSTSKFTHAPMKRLLTGEYQAPDYPAFLPNLSPSEMFHAGIFGGTYFRDITLDGKSWHCNAWKEFQSHGFFDDLEISTRVASGEYVVSRNRYGVRCGQDLQTWVEKGWIKEKFDSHGWVHWYCRFYLGRRCSDDDRQISRWSACAGGKGRWKRFLIAKCVKKGSRFDDESVSPTVRQLLLHWAYQLTERHFNQYKSMIEKGHKTSFIPQRQMAHVVKNQANRTSENDASEREQGKAKRAKEQKDAREQRRLKRARLQDSARD